MRECLQKFETLEKSIQFTKVCEDASFWKRVSIGMCHKTIADVDDGFGDRTPACREYTHPRADSVPQFHDELLLDQFFKFILNSFLALMELKFRFHPQQRQIVPLG